ncbi:sigma D regulator [Thalassotalea sediminis]|uniref:sigma D regulator n=1 Tax=Thalassotalea sediminis TaxID=1759089 RepID=UPI00257433A3|nr:sigma D regulator [Thalassotalea sediminis]
MLTKLEQSKSRWGGQNQVVDDWLQERQAVLVAYCDLIGLYPIESSDKSLPNARHIQRFCQRLMDYISASHFEIFHDVIEQCQEKGPEDKRNAEKIFPLLNHSTDLALTFNDKFAEVNTTDLPENFDIQLASLGRALEERFNHEDQLLAMLYRY